MLKIKTLNSEDVKGKCSYCSEMKKTHTFFFYPRQNKLNKFTVRLDVVSLNLPHGQTKDFFSFFFFFYSPQFYPKPLFILPTLLLKSPDPPDSSTELCCTHTCFTHSKLSKTLSSQPLTPLG